MVVASLARAAIPWAPDLKILALLFAIGGCTMGAANPSMMPTPFFLSYCFVFSQENRTHLQSILLLDPKFINVDLTSCFAREHPVLGVKFQLCGLLVDSGQRAPDRDLG